MKAPQNLLLIKMSSLGDVVHGVPTLSALRARYPNARITWLVDERFRDVIAAHPALDEVLTAPSPRWVTQLPWNHTTRAACQYRVIPELRRRRFDCVLDLQGLLRTGFLAAATGARVRIGLTEAREGAPYFYSHTTSAPWPWHAVRRCLRLAEFLDAPIDPASDRIVVDPNWRETSQTLREAKGLAATEDYAIIAPRSSRREKNWPPDSFSRLIAALWEARGLRSVLIGSAADAPACAAIADKSHSPAVTVTGLPLGVAMALSADAKLVVSNDSGPLHLAAALGRPLVGIYGPTDIGRVGPWQQERWVVQENAHCQRCQIRKGRRWRRWSLRRLAPHTCLSALPVERVFARAEAALDEALARKRSA